MHELREIIARIDRHRPQEFLTAAVDYFGDRISLATSFQLGGLVLIDMLHRTGKEIRVFSIDTGRLPEQTYECAERVRLRYGIKVEWFFPDCEKVQKIETEKGLYSFKQSVENRRECCRIRKVEPLKRALEGFDAWVTGRRLDQSDTRSEIAVVEEDPVHRGKIKINPLLHWSNSDLWHYVHKHNVPSNRLYEMGYLSIGCNCCTRPCREGEDERAGRWWWELPEHKECGLHISFSNGAGI